MEAGVTIVGLKVASGARRAPAGAVGTATRASLQYTHGFVPQCQFPVILFKTMNMIMLLMLSLRYVDHLLLLGPSSTFQHSMLQSVCSSGFYEGFQLETMDDHRWLELFMPSPQQRGLGMPEKPRQIRSPLSAKSWRPSASEFFTPKPCWYVNVRGVTIWC